MSFYEDGVLVWDKYPSLRQCRGTTFDVDTGDIILYPFDKFFEVDQVQETAMDVVVDKIKNAKTIEFSEKLDGSLASMRYYKGNLEVASMGANESDLVDQIKADTNDNIKRMCKENPNLTFIFEELEDLNIHVVKYEPEQLGLYLLAFRDMDTYRVSTYKEACELADKYGVRHTEIHNTTIEEQIAKLEKTAGTEREGCVINIDGFRVKLKSENYKMLHHIKTGIGDNEIIKRYVNGTLDEVLEYFTYRQKQFLVKVKEYERIHYIESRPYVECMPADKRTFFTQYIQRVPKHLKKIVITAFTKGTPQNPLIDTAYSPEQIGYVNAKKVLDFFEKGVA